ncbi:MAG TPA: DUF1553 domain-containing protein, partial [Planctomycetota bacterium]|nr:DUF1553 domain-containing protein [Planctomycetota bacterium]
ATHPWNEDDSINVSHAIARRLPAETLFDAIHQATGSLTRIPGMRIGATAAELPDPSVTTGDGFLDLFGRPPRESACECERVSGMSLGQALSLVNGPTVAESIKDPQNSISNLASIEGNPKKLVEELFVSFLCRPPTEKELEVAKSLDGLDPANAASLDPADRKMLDERLAAWEKAQTIVVWNTLEPGIVKSAGGASFATEPDGSVLASGANPDKDTVTLVAWTSLEKITGVRLEVLPHESLKAKGPGRSENGNLVLSELRVVAAPAGDPAQAKAVVLQNAVADFAQEGWPAAAAIDGKLEKGWAILPQTGKEHEAIFETKEDLGAPGGTILTVILDQQFGQMHTIGRFRLSVTTSPRPVRLRQVPDAIAAILLTSAEKRSPEQVTALTAYFLRKDPDMVRRIRLANAQDLAWALANSPAFLFNR